MGVRGLMSYIESEKDILKDLQFSSSKLIIDGYNLLYTLFYDNELDQMYGGDYDVFEGLITEFFTNLKDCDIDSFVVVDGGADHTDRKFDTLLQRDKDKVRKTYDLSMKEKGSCPPQLLRNVFMQTFDKLKVSYVQCIQEADVEVATLAKQWNCPVLSNDSDFCIFDIPAGILPLKDFQWKNGTNKKYIPSKHFTVERLCSLFNRMNRGLLPIFACILGNDYVKLQNIASLGWEKYSKHVGKFARIDGLLHWLSRFSEPEAAIDDILKLIPDKKEKDDVREALCGIEDYQLKTSTALTGPLQALPDWTLNLLKQGKMGSFLINILILKRVIMIPQVEDFHLPSSSITSRPIRQVLYGLILLGEQQTADKHVLAAKASMDTDKCYVMEYIRQVINKESDEKFNLICSKVEAIETKVKKGLQLETLQQEPLALRLQVFLDTLGVSSSVHIKTIPPDLQLQVIMTRYWLVNAHPKPKDLHLWALLLGMIHGKLSNTQKVGGLDRLVKLKSQERIRLDREVAHLYSQWQGCLWWSLNLNRLLCFPLPEPECARLYSGTLVHRIVQELKTGITPESLLEKDSDAEQLFRLLRDAVRSLVDKDGQNQSLDALHSDFQHSESEGSSIRPRHKTKASNANHPTNKPQRRCFE